MSAKMNDVSVLKFDNDLVTTFFDEINKLQDINVFNFIEDLKKDIETIV